MKNKSLRRAGLIIAAMAFLTALYNSYRNIGRNISPVTNQTPAVVSELDEYHQDHFDRNYLEFELAYNEERMDRGHRIERMENCLNRMFEVYSSSSEEQQRSQIGRFGCALRLMKMCYNDEGSPNKFSGYATKASSLDLEDQIDSNIKWK